MLLVLYDRGFLVCLTAICKMVRGEPLACSVAMATRPGSQSICSSHCSVNRPTGAPRPYATHRRLRRRNRLNPCRVLASANRGSTQIFRFQMARWQASVLW